MKLSFIAFIAEYFPHLIECKLDIIEKVFSDLGPNADLEQFATRLSSMLVETSGTTFEDLASIETTPMVTIKQRIESENTRMIDSIHGFFTREKLRRSITPEEKRWMLRGMILTRTVDLALKKIFLSSDLKYNDIGFQGKGFRSLGQEAIYAAALRLKHGEFLSKGKWKGDVVAPLIRDLGVALAFTGDDVESALNAQAAKEGPPMNGRDLHIGDFEKGVWPAAAPLAISSCSIVGIAQAFKLKNESRVGVSFIGEGGSSLGEWHEAINYAACQKLPVIFCVENNQTALSTKQAEQSAVRVFADKAVGYGISGITIDGTNPEDVACAFAWAAQRAREGKGATLLELVSMRMCGHAHHDDMLYLGHDSPSSLDYPKAESSGYVDVERYDLWAKKDPILNYSRSLISSKICTKEEVESFKIAAKQTCDQALENLKSRNWPKPESHGSHVFFWPKNASQPTKVETAAVFSKEGSTYLESIAQAVQEQMRSDERVYLLGEDVSPPYGNAFMMFRGIPENLWPRFINTPIAENAIVGALVGMAAEGLKPIGEMQFNDFSASAFNQIVNNAAKLHYRTNIRAPFVLRMPYGGLRRAGPFHSQDTIPWFHRAFGLNIVAPSTPHDARALFHESMKSLDPVLFYEHIALYRDPKIKQLLSKEIPILELGKAALRREGSDLTLVSYGAYVHKIVDVAQRLCDEHDIQCDVIDLRSLVPLDFDTIGLSVAKTGRVLLVSEDSRTGGYMESLASKIGEGLFEHLDGPVRVIGSLDTPIPYAPSLEDAYLADNKLIFDAAVELANW